MWAFLSFQHSYLSLQAWEKVYLGVYSWAFCQMVAQLLSRSWRLGMGKVSVRSRLRSILSAEVHHRHLVSLVGYCIADGQRMLVYDFVPNNTLCYHLHDENSFLSVILFSNFYLMPASWEHSNYSSLIWSLTWPLKTAVSDAALDCWTRLRLQLQQPGGLVTSMKIVIF